LSEKRRGKPFQIEEENVFIDDETDHENAAGRISKYGLGAELVRESEWQRLRPYLEAFRSHAPVQDMVTLRTAFETQEEAADSCSRLSLAEALLAVLGIDAASSHTAHREPIREARSGVQASGNGGPSF